MIKKKIQYESKRVNYFKNMSYKIHFTLAIESDQIISPTKA